MCRFISRNIKFETCMERGTARDVELLLCSELQEPYFAWYVERGRSECAWMNLTSNKNT